MEEKINNSIEMNRLGIYIHIPFCVKKCDYCDFLSAPGDEKTMELYVNALVREIGYSEKFMEDYVVDTIFIGGGTPSILNGKNICNILGALREKAHVSENCEITIECNPGTLNEEKLEYYKKAGINRISIGLQSADNNELKSIGRIHSWQQFEENYRVARTLGFNNINVDLMSGLPGQSLMSYKNTLDKVIALEPEHISAYSLIVEEGTPMHDRVAMANEMGQSILPNEDEERKMYYLTGDLLKQAGYYRYEISNYCRSGYECRHNVGYWKRKDYLGFGIGAASLYKEERYNNISDVKDYIKFDKTDDLRVKKEMLTINDAMEEYMFLGLRMMKGINMKEFEDTFNKKKYECMREGKISYNSIYGNITEKLEKQGMLKIEGDNVRLTARGIDVSNVVLAEFLL